LNFSEFLAIKCPSLMEGSAGTLNFLDTTAQKVYNMCNKRRVVPVTEGLGLALVNLVNIRVYTEA